MNEFNSFALCRLIIYFVYYKLHLFNGIGSIQDTHIASCNNKILYESYHRMLPINSAGSELMYALGYLGSPVASSKNHAAGR